MMTNYQKKQEYFLEKLALLEKAKAVLKSEFIGIDTIIDEITSNVSAWFCFPELQEKPIVINLWGLTGVGKTSLINRLVELIDFKNHYYRFDLGEKEGDYSFRHAIDYLGKSEQEKPAIIMFDEFQHTRSINHQKVETENDKNRMVWELLDSGKITFLEWKRGTYAFAEFVSKFHVFAKNGLTVENGYVTSFIKEYDKEMCVLCFEEGKEYNISVIPNIHLDYILNITNKHYDISIESQLEEFIKNKSVEELKMFFDNILDLGQRPVTKYLNKSLIFVLGNLDEAYTMSGNLNSDIDADVFHELSKEINVPQIKKALKERFRNEQIARLGNIHIIYPAFSRKNYEDIISLELKKFKKKVEQQLQINITFKPSVNELIYKEGVYPTQGVRPIFTTIYQLIKSKIGEIYSQIIIQKAPIDEIEFEIIKNTLVVQFFKGEVKIDKKEFSLSLILSDLRKNKKDELQAICAVHEAGHAILNVALMNTLPEMIFSVTANADSEGFVYAKYNWDYIAKNEILPRMAVMLGGLAAEELIFGAENVTLGAAGDIDQATAFLMHHYMRSGMGDVPIKYVQNNMEIGYTNTSDIQNKVKETIIKAKELALITLQNEKKFLIELANFLSNESTITQEHFLEMVNAFASKKPQINSRQNSQLYRKRLQELKNELDKECKTEHTLKATYFSLNKDKH